MVFGPRKVDTKLKFLLVLVESQRLVHKCIDLVEVVTRACVCVFINLLEMLYQSCFKRIYLSIILIETYFAFCACMSNHVYPISSVGIF